MFPNGGICRADNFRHYGDLHKPFPAIALHKKIKFIALTQTCQLPPKNSWDSKLGFGMSRAGDCWEVGRYHTPAESHLVGNAHCWVNMGVGVP